MVNQKILVLAAVLLLVVGLVATAADANQRCRRVNGNIKTLSELWEDPAVCDGYEFCQYAEVTGTVNGLWWVYGNWEDIEEVAGGEGLVNHLVSVMETNRGDVYADDMELGNLNAPDGWVFHHAVTGGTGKYEGATGWLAGWFSWETFRGKIGGKICWNGRR